MTFALAYVASVGLGWLVVNLCMIAMCRSIGQPRKFFRPLDLWVGGTERAVATTLVIWAPSVVALFVGGWVALKVAANWARQEGPGVPERHMVALVGSVISFAVAIGVGVLAHPASLAAWAPPVR